MPEPTQTDWDEVHEALADEPVCLNCDDHGCPYCDDQVLASPAEEQENPF